MANRFLIAVAALVVAMPQLAFARDQLRIVGSSTMFPFVAAAAEQFGYDGTFRTPIVEATGTGGGIKSFCAGVGEHYPDMVNASRTMKDSEREQCAKHGVVGLTELKLGYDGIVLANAVSSPSFSLSRRVLFLALARDVPVGGKLVVNPYQRWREIDPALPDLPIRVYGRPPSSGTRDAFSELVMIEGCKQLPAMQALIPDSEKRKHQCMTMREDGHYIEAGDDNNLIVQKLVNNPESLGLFGYSFLESNAAQVKANPVDGVMPSYESIVSGAYPVARSLFVYVKNAHLATTPGLADFAQELVCDAAVGEDGYLVMKGLLPPKETERQEVQRTAAGLSVVSSRLPD